MKKKLVKNVFRVYNTPEVKKINNQPIEEKYYVNNGKKQNRRIGA